MEKRLVALRKLFEVEDVFGRKVRTTEHYWRKIKEEKHKELEFGVREVIATLKQPDEVYQSVRDEYIYLYFKGFDEGKCLIVAVKRIEERGFVVTVYQTSKPKRKGEKLWPK